MSHFPPYLGLFYMQDVLIDIISAVILLVILILIIQFYNINKPKKGYTYLISSFTLIFLSFLFKILSHMRIYYYSTTTKEIGAITLMYRTINTSETLVYVGLLFYHIVFLIGIYLLYAAYLRKEELQNKLLVIFLLVLVGIFSNFTYYPFYITSTFIIGLVTWSFWQVYKKNRMLNTRLITFSFLLLMVSQLLFLLMFASVYFYAAAEIVQLTAYLLLLFTFLKVLRDGKKKG